MIIRKNEDEFIIIENSNIEDYYGETQTIQENIITVNIKQIENEISQIELDINNLSNRKEYLMNIKSQIDNLINN